MSSERKRGVKCKKDKKKDCKKFSLLKIRGVYFFVSFWFVALSVISQAIFFHCLKTVIRRIVKYEI